MIKKYYRGKYLRSVVNDKGRKASVVIFQGKRSGFTIQYASSKRFIGTTRSAEASAVRLAKSGHNRVTILD